MARFTDRGTAAKPISETKGLKANMGVVPEYLATLLIDGVDGVTEVFETPLPEDISLQMSSEWVNSFEKASDNAQQMVTESLARSGSRATRALAALGSFGMTASGIKARSQPLSAQVWESSSPVSFSLPFTFVVKTDAKADVMDKMRTLLKAQAPQKLGPIITAPGPSLLGNTIGGRHIELQLGRFLLLNNCIINNVDVQISSILGVNGLPHKAVCNVQVTSYFACFTAEDIDDMFNLTPFKRLLDFS